MNRRQFFKQSFCGAAAIAGTPLLADSLLSSEPPKKARRPNLLLIMTDQHRGDCLGANGNKVIRTPNLDRLANEGVRFRCGYSCAPTCTPARAAVLTGLGPWRNGLLGYGEVAARYPVEMPRALREEGYQTLGIGKMHWMPPRNRHGFHRTVIYEEDRLDSPGFEDDYKKWFHEHAPKGMSPMATGLGWNDHRARAYALPEEFHPTRWVADRTIDFLEGYNEPAPFFLKVSFQRPHSPYDPPKRFLEAYREDEMPAPNIGEWAEIHAQRNAVHPNDLWEGDLGLAQVRRSRRGYYGSVSFIDEQIGRIRGMLESRGLLENTFVLFVSDHGDMTGDHYLWRKSYAYEASAHVPCFVRPPAWMPFQRAQVLSQCVELRDVLPTFLDVTGTKNHANLEGKSLLPLLRGEIANWRPWIDLEHSVCYSPTNHYNALTDGRYKYIYHALRGEEQLFDLAEDPGELHDLSAEKPHREHRLEWRRRLAAHLAERGSQFVVNGDLVPRPEDMLYSPNYPRAAASTAD